MTARVLLLFPLVTVPARLLAQDPVQWTVAAPRHAVAVGAATSVRVRGVIAPGWHIYALTQGPGGPVPSAVTVPTGQPFHLSGRVTSTPPRVSFDSNFSIMVEAIESEALFTVPITIDRDAETGRHDLRVNVRYQVCNARLCNPVRTERLVAAITLKRSPP